MISRIRIGILLAGFPKEKFFKKFTVPLVMLIFCMDIFSFGDQILRPVPEEFFPVDDSQIVHT